MSNSVVSDVESAASALRVVSTRLNSTETRRLPHVVPQLVKLLPQCTRLLSSGESRGGREKSENGVLVHRWRTRIASLLQDGSVEGRWSAVVLAKATIEAGGPETLQKSGSWIANLLSILSKPDPVTSKELCIITLTRIFLLAHDHPSVVREIVTPSLPPFITSCLRLIESPSNSTAFGRLSITVFSSFSRLLTNHPNIFRTFSGRIKELTSSVIDPTSSKNYDFTSLVFPSELARAAQQLNIQLHQSALKAQCGEEWTRELKDVISNTHRITDQVFRAVIEDWIATTSTNGSNHASSNGILKFDDSGDIHTNSDRLINSLSFIQLYIATPTSTVVNFPMGSVMELLSRLLSLIVPSKKGSADWSGGIRFNAQISNEERQALWTLLPHVHATTIEIIVSLIDRFGGTFVSGLDILIDQIVWVNDAENGHECVRLASYLSIQRILACIGQSLSKASLNRLAPLLKSCCDDLLRHTPHAAGNASVQKESAKSNIQEIKALTTQLSSATPIPDPITRTTGLQGGAAALLSTFLSNVPAHHVSSSLRTQLDRTAVLMAHEDAMLASILNPAPRKPSILPFLARTHPHSPQVETLLRPRMPVIRTGASTSVDGADDEVEDIDAGVEMTPTAAEDEEPDPMQSSAAASATPTGATFVNDQITENVTAAEAAEYDPVGARQRTASPSDQKGNFIDPSQSGQPIDLEPPMGAMKRQQSPLRGPPSPKRQRIDIDEQVPPIGITAQHPVETISGLSAEKNQGPAMVGSSSASKSVGFDTGASDRNAKQVKQGDDSYSDSDGDFVVPPITFGEYSDEDE